MFFKLNFQMKKRNISIQSTLTHTSFLMLNKNSQDTFFKDTGSVSFKDKFDKFLFNEFEIGGPSVCLF